MSKTPFRTSSTSAGRQYWRAQQSITCYLAWFRKQHSTDIALQSNTALRLSYRWLEMGYGLDIAISAITSLFKNDVNVIAGVTPHPELATALPTPVHYEEMRSVVHYLPIHADDHNHIKKWWREIRNTSRMSRNESIDNAFAGYVWKMPTDTQVSTQEERFKAIKQNLEDTHRLMWSRWLNSPEGAGLLNNLYYHTVPHSLALSTLAYSCNNIAVAHGRLPPGLAVALQRLPLPADPDPYGDQLAQHWPPPYALALARQRGRKPIPQSANDLTATWEQNPTIAPRTFDYSREQLDEWAKQARKDLRTMAKELKSSLPRKRLTKTSSMKVSQMVREWGQRFPDTLLPTSAAWLGLIWVANLLQNGRIKASTAAQYLTEVIAQALVFHDSALDLSNWDDEDVDRAFELLSVDRGLGEPTIKQRAVRTLSFLTHSKRMGFLVDTTLPTIEGGYLAHRYRNHLITPSRIDSLIDQLVSTAKAETDAATLLIFLAFYAGLRAREVLSIQLRDIDEITQVSEFVNAVDSQAEIFLTIRSGKTPSARRKLPLHVLLPPDAIAILRTIIQRRKAQFPKRRRLRKVFLAGPASATQGFDYDQICPFTISHLRRLLDDAVDIHTLRHNFATWWLLRFLQSLGLLISAGWADCMHPIFSHEMTEKLSDHLAWGRPSEDRNYHEFIELAKLMGHSNFEMTRKTYLHSISFYQSTRIYR
jgi:integrase